MTLKAPISVTIYSEMAPKLNFACHQSAFAFLRDLRIENNDPELALDNVVVTLSSNPSFLKPKSWRLEQLAPSGIVHIKDRDIELDGNFLLHLSDSIRGSVTITVEKDSSTLLKEESKTVELLAYNEWGGAGYMPELLAAFSIPNDPAVDRVLRDASLVLRKVGKPDGIYGYKSGSRQRVWEIASAIYTAVCNLGISYSLPPSSFEQNGQKIRLPGQILENRVATCLDTSMLFASALEQAGLNPIIALPNEHAVAGVWLQPEELSTIVIDEAETLRKRVQLKELLLIETTFVTSHPSPPFSKSVAAANDMFFPERDGSFNAAIDIRKARAHRFTPLGLKTGKPSDETESENAGSVELAMEDAPVLPDFDDNINEEKPDTPSGRLDRWQRKLLDLTARNALLNHRSSKTSLRIICPDPGFLEDKLAEGARISIQTVPRPTTLAQDEEIHRQRTGEVITEEYARSVLEKNQVLVDLPEAELSVRAVEIYRKAQTALQEGGANTLYLALGFLLWKHKEKDDRRFRAPLILLPVTLERKSVRSGIKMLAHDDEPRFNTTLLEMLRRDFDIDIRGLDGALPLDESGVDVNGIWDRMRREVKYVPGFEVIEDVVLGHFSFAKYLMWKDLVDRTDELRKNPVVRHLIDTPRENYPSDVSFVDAARLDQDFKPSDILAPLPVDSSQMAAIASAERGKDFIIIGPPGTGKSQTISNMIAHMLGKGKTVLFVSEKTAALEVVYRRLKDIGLERFCLELHSNKSSKTDVLKQLDNAWVSCQSKDVGKWENEAERLRALRDQLNFVVDRLHIRRRNGMTAFYAMGVKVRDGEFASRVNFSWPSADQHDEEELQSMHEAVEKLCVHLAEIGDVSKNTLQLITKGDWSPQWESQVVEQSGRLSVAADAAELACNALLEVLGITVPDRTMARLDAIASFAKILSESYRKQTAYALETDAVNRIEALEEAVSRLKAYADAQTKLSCSYDPLAWRNLDGNEIARRWKAANAAIWPKRIIERKRLIKEMKAGGAQGDPDPERDAVMLKRLREEGEAIDRLEKMLSGFKDWQGYDTNSDALSDLQNLGQTVRIAVSRLVDDASTLAELRGKIRILLNDGNDLLAPDATVGLAVHEFLKMNSALQDACDDFEAIAGKAIRDHFSKTDKALEAIRETAETITLRHTELRDWCAWRRSRTAALDLELAPLVEAIENGRVPVDEIEKTFEAAYCAWWSSAVIGEDEILRTFSTPEHTATIEKFRTLDQQFQRLTADYILAKLSGKLPDSDEVKRNSSWGNLRREIKKTIRHKPVRQLLDEIPDVLTTLAPCLMMSPLSVAQYLPAGQEHFDVVIFDEASQITVWDAVGALARGRQVIVAGDPKQMPPTNFFARTDDDSYGDIETESDLESILDEMLGASIPEKLLNLHYRSRRESLIAFSNSRYYDNELITFPAPVHPDLAVSLRRPEGYYARGKGRHNEGEARAIVSEILMRLTHSDENLRKQSIGVVTFNSEQQSLIENMLDAARSKNPHIEWAFSSQSVLEPVFVKNLETVQGDERDVILFSVTYGPDQSGYITMNFGPLNRDGGERRLNVAMTRARSEMVVFSTLSPDRIDLSRTQARAVTDLKHFLEYAERGPSVLGAAVYGSIRDFDSPFELAVARALRDKGWKVHPQVGVSAYRIDLGIVHPDEPGRYLAGIECDGAMYHSSAFAKERDKIRQSVLEGLGWKLLRIWSTDWWTYHAKALNDLHDELKNLLEADRQKKKEKVVSQTENRSDKNGDNDSLKENYSEDNRRAITEEEAMKEVNHSDFIPPQSGMVERRHTSETAMLNQDLQSVTDKSPDRLDEDAKCIYKVATLDEEIYRPEPEIFYSDEYKPRLMKMINYIIDIESPIHEHVLIRRIARHHGFHRAGKQIRDIVINLARPRSNQTKERIGLFFWRKGISGEDSLPARYENRNDEMRKVEYICKEEIQAINSLLSMDGDPVEFARRIGIVRLSQNARKRLVEVFESFSD